MGRQPKLMVPPKPATNVGDWMATLREALFDSVTEADVADIAKGLVDRAKGGDLKATDMLFRYVLGGQNGVKVQKAVIVQQPEQGSTRGPEHEVAKMIRKGEMKLMRRLGDGAWDRVDPSEVGLVDRESA